MPGAPAGPARRAFSPRFSELDVSRRLRQRRFGASLALRSHALPLCCDSPMSSATVTCLDFAVASRSGSLGDQPFANVAGGIPVSLLVEPSSCPPPARVCRFRRSLRAVARNQVGRWCADRILGREAENARHVAPPVHQHDRRSCPDMLITSRARFDDLLPACRRL